MKYLKFFVSSMLFIASSLWQAYGASYTLTMVKTNTTTSESEEKEDIVNRRRIPSRQFATCYITDTDVEISDVNTEDIITYNIIIDSQTNISFSEKDSFLQYFHNISGDCQIEFFTSDARYFTSNQ